VRPITFLSDYGLDDDFAGVCHAVIARAAPEARVIDLTHGIARHDVRTGAIVLRRALPYTPPGVHLAIVDPGVGGARRAVAIRCAEEDRILVGPDNGLLALAAARFGEAVAAVDIGRSAHRLEPVSATFHGRDVFAPVAAALAAGAPLGDAGSWVDVTTLAGLELPAPRREGADLVAHALAFDRYGNVSLEVGHAWLTVEGLKIGRALTVNGHPATYGLTFADVAPGALLVYEDADRTLALAVNRDSARALLGLELDAELRIAPA
jgi:S-adenosylmethionine hydrolase